VGWLIDTSLWIAVERGAFAAADIHAITRQDPVYLSPVNVAETGSAWSCCGPVRRSSERRRCSGGSVESLS